MEKDWKTMISAANGTFALNDTTEKVYDCNVIFVLEDTVIARIELNGVTSTDVKADYISTPATALKAGAYLCTNGGAYFSAVTLTSGSVILIKN
jgi:hypothetical protein